MKLLGKIDGNTVRVYNDGKLYGTMDFSRERKNEADLFIYGTRFRVSNDSSGRLSVTKADIPVFAFGFDGSWGEAEIFAAASDYRIAGKWFKPGTQLVDENSRNLVVVRNVANEFDIEVTDESLAPVMVLSTLYYHIYASRPNTFGISVAS